MNARLHRFCALALCAGGFVLFTDAQIVPEFPVYPATSDADPSIRHEVVIPMPTRLSVERESNRLSVGFDLSSPRRVKITVGKKMSIGVKYEMRVYAKSEARPQEPSGIGYAEIKEPVTLSEAGFLNGRAFLNRAECGIPAPGKRYVIEEDVAIYETDIPAQHLRFPESGRYRVLWAEKLKTVR
jgi:hypothetical protein